MKPGPPPSLGYALLCAWPGVWALQPTASAATPCTSRCSTATRHAQLVLGFAIGCASSGSSSAPCCARPTCSRCRAPPRCESARACGGDEAEAPSRSRSLAFARSLSPARSRARPLGLLPALSQVLQCFPEQVPAFLERLGLEAAPPAVAAGLERGIEPGRLADDAGALLSALGAGGSAGRAAGGGLVRAIERALAGAVLAPAAPRAPPGGGEPAPPSRSTRSASASRTTSRASSCCRPCSRTRPSRRPSSRPSSASCCCASSGSSSRATGKRRSSLATVASLGDDAEALSLPRSRLSGTSSTSRCT